MDRLFLRITMLIGFTGANILSYSLFPEAWVPGLGLTMVIVSIVTLLGEIADKLQGK